jgi:hypothetical protein
MLVNEKVMIMGYQDIIINKPSISCQLVGNDQNTDKTCLCRSCKNKVILCKVTVAPRLTRAVSQRETTGDFTLK